MQSDRLLRVVQSMSPPRVGRRIGQLQKKVHGNEKGSAAVDALVQLSQLEHPFGLQKVPLEIPNSCLAIACPEVVFSSFLVTLISFPFLQIIKLLSMV